VYRHDVPSRIGQRHRARGVVRPRPSAPPRRPLRDSIAVDKDVVPRHARVRDHDSRIGDAGAKGEAKRDVLVGIAAASRDPAVRQRGRRGARDHRSQRRRQSRQDRVLVRPRAHQQQRSRHAERNLAARAAARRRRRRQQRRAAHRRSKREAAHLAWRSKYCELYWDAHDRRAFTLRVALCAARA